MPVLTAGGFNKRRTEEKKGMPFTFLSLFLRSSLIEINILIFNPCNPNNASSAATWCNWCTCMVITNARYVVPMLYPAAMETIAVPIIYYRRIMPPNKKATLLLHRMALILCRTEVLSYRFTLHTLAALLTVIFVQYGFTHTDVFGGYLNTFVLLNIFHTFFQCKL